MGKANSFSSLDFVYKIKQKKYRIKLYGLGTTTPSRM